MSINYIVILTFLWILWNLCNYFLLFADDIKLAAIICEKCLIFSMQRNVSSCIKAEYKMGDHIIERVDEINDMGILMNKWFLTGSYVEQMTMKTSQIIGCINVWNQTAQIYNQCRESETIHAENCMLTHPRRRSSAA